MSEPRTAEEWRLARASVATRWPEVSVEPRPASSFEVGGAVTADALVDLNIDRDEHRLAYDRRMLLNIVAVLLDERSRQPDLRLADLFTTQLQETGTLTVYPGDEAAAIVAVRNIHAGPFTVALSSAPSEATDV